MDRLSPEDLLQLVDAGVDGNASDMVFIIHQLIICIIFS